MLLSRWENYIKTYHGGNKKIKKIVEKKGKKYVENNFQYSILENYNQKVDDAIVREREIYWKKVLNSVDKGMNDNY